MKLFLVASMVLLSFVLVDSRLVKDPEYDSIWDRFKARHNKTYGDTYEAEKRRHIFEDHIRLIQEHNLEADLGNENFTIGLNEYSDWTQEEVKKFLNGFRTTLLNMKEFRDSKEDEDDGIEEPVVVQSESLPASVDWVKKGAVTPIKTQGSCGSCYTFSATGALEGAHFIKNKALVSMSEQNLLDCSGAYGNKGCEGGVTDYCFKYVKTNNGVVTGSSYPYIEEVSSCKYNSANKVTSCSTWKTIPKGNESELQKAVANIGPIAAAIDASSYKFQMYKSGIYSSSDCSADSIDHAVLVVGYGTENDTPYWLVKNSWGTKWGLSGYFKLARNQGNMCGIAQQASYPVL